jgi:uncharacterized phage protein gp47/JayE
MATDYLPGKFLTPTRDQIAADFRRSYQVRNPGADVGPGSQPMLDSLAAADMALPLYAYAGRVAGNATWLTATGNDLRNWAQSFGTDFLPAVGAAGFVQIGTSSGGTFIQANDQLSVNGIVYQAIAGGFFQNGQLVAIVGVTTGPQTDQDTGTVLTWSTPRPGLEPSCTVAVQPDGSGLSGGANVETEAQLKQRLSWIKSNPAGSGNDAHIQWIVSRTPGIGVQQVFTYPAIEGPGTVGVTFTIRPAQTGGPRIPNSAQLTLALGYLQQYVPATTAGIGLDTGLLMCAVVSSSLNLILQVQWAQNAPGWADANQFPLYQGVGNNWVVTNVVTPTPTTFNIMSPTDPTVPQAGQSIGFLNLPLQEFSRKRILTATAASGGYTIVVDPTNGTSDLTYTPIVGQILSPWSDSLDSLIAPVLAYMDSIGPGEQVTGFFDAGLRQKRSPASPGAWTSVINNRLLGGPPNAAQPPDPNSSPTPTLLSTNTLADVELTEPVPPFQTPVGSQGVSSNLLVLTSLAAFPE